MFRYDVPSGVSDQPMGDVETKQGCGNRAVAAAAAFEKEHGEAPHFSVGLEGGVGEEDGGCVCLLIIPCPRTAHRKIESCHDF